MFHEWGAEPTSIVSVVSGAVPGQVLISRVCSNCSLCGLLSPGAEQGRVPQPVRNWAVVGLTCRGLTQPVGMLWLGL